MKKILQEDVNSSRPIVFLSVETNPKRKIVWK